MASTMKLSSARASRPATANRVAAFKPATACGQRVVSVRSSNSKDVAELQQAGQVSMGKRELMAGLALSAAAVAVPA